MSEFENIPRFSDLFTRWDKIGDTIWQLNQRALAGCDDMWQTLFSKLYMILLMWLGLTSRNRMELDIDWMFWGMSSVDWKELEICRPNDAKKLLNLLEMSWFALYSVTLHMRDLI